VIEIRVPELDSRGEMSGGSGVSEAEISSWLSPDGSQVACGQEVLELVLDKVNVTIEAPAAGVLRHRAQPGDIVAAGEVVATIEEERDV